MANHSSLLGLGFPGSSVDKLPAVQKTWGSITGSGRSPGGGHGNPLQSSCLENPMDRGAWWATDPQGSVGHKESDMTEAV